MKLSYEEFVEKHKDVIETGKPSKEFLKDLYEIIEVINEGEKTSFIITLHKLMVEILKYQYGNQDENNIIKLHELGYEVEIYKEFSQDAYNKVTDEDIDKIYHDSIIDVSFSLKIDKECFSENKPKEFTKEILSDHQLLCNNILIPYSKSSESKRYLKLKE